jgi:hypothetical protein
MNRKKERAYRLTRCVSSPLLLAQCWVLLGVAGCCWVLLVLLMVAVKLMVLLLIVDEVVVVTLSVYYR